MPATTYCPVCVFQSSPGTLTGCNDYALYIGGADAYVSILTRHADRVQPKMRREKGLA